MALSKMNRSKGCFFQCGDTCTEYDDDYVSDITKHAPKRWKKFEDQALLWRGLDKFGRYMTLLIGKKEEVALY